MLDRLIWMLRVPSVEERCHIALNFAAQLGRTMPSICKVVAGLVDCIPGTVHRRQLPKHSIGARVHRRCSVALSDDVEAGHSLFPCTRACLLQTGDIASGRAP